MSAVYEVRPIVVNNRETRDFIIWDRVAEKNVTEELARGAGWPLPAERDNHTLVVTGSFEKISRLIA